VAAAAAPKLTPAPNSHHLVQTANETGCSVSYKWDRFLETEQGYHFSYNKNRLQILLLEEEAVTFSLR
jgi:hypothetical protein